MTDGPEIGVDDAVVLLLGASGGPGVSEGELKGITRLEKLVFLLEKETSAREWLTEDAKFEAYNFGPFSAEVYRAVDMLSAAGLLIDSAKKASSDEDTWEQWNRIDEKTDLPGSDPYVTRDFKLTSLGWRYFRSLERDLPAGALGEVSRLKTRFARLPLRQLVRYVYERYDEYTKNSIIRDEILGTER